VAICTNISCWLNGAEDIVRHCEKKLGIKHGESTADGRVYLKREEECLAGCGGAPMMVINGHYHERLTLEKSTSCWTGWRRAWHITTPRVRSAPRRCRTRWSTPPCITTPRGRTKAT
jgi:hypothetical protein